MTLGMFVVGCWFGMVILALVRINADHGQCEDCAYGAGIVLRDRNGRRIVLEPDGSRKDA
jgi:hypothetical protein